MTTQIAIGYHGHCFDGMASAALLTRLLQHQLGPELQFRYFGLDHQPGGSHVPESSLNGDINAVVDFRYSTSDKLTWWFDHHLTGLVGAAEHEHFARDRSGLKFFDPEYGSCTKLIADIARAHFGLDLSPYADLIHWAHLIDTAGFPDAQTAVALSEPALQLMTVIESHGTDAFIVPRIERLAAGEPLQVIAQEPSIESLFKPLHARNEQTCELIKQRAVLRDGVVHFDLAGVGDDRYNKFIPYLLFPEARYCVAVTVGPVRAKVSVGSNPWSVVPRTHDISSICARYGGGGHAVVGAVSLAASEVDKARSIAGEIISELTVS
jgi:hypothetical protein